MPLTVTRDVLLSERTTLRLGGPALAEAVVTCAEGLDELAVLLPGLGGRPMALGAGSNILAGDGPHQLVLVRAAGGIAGGNAPQIKVRADGTPLVRADAALGLPRLLGLCQRAGLTGLEGLTGIPGRVGGALAMNAGSYGVEFGRRLTRVRLWTPEAGLMWREARGCSLGYRHFDPGLNTDFWLIWQVELALDLDEPAAVRSRMQATYSKKKASQPVTAKSAGCVFKNPIGKSAGQLLDEAGMRGKRLGNMAFSAVHANFLVNEGHGTAAQALELLELGRQAVAARFGVTLETEVKVLQ